MLYKGLFNLICTAVCLVFNGVILGLAKTAKSKTSWVEADHVKRRAKMEKRLKKEEQELEEKRERKKRKKEEEKRAKEQQEAAAKAQQQQQQQQQQSTHPLGEQQEEPNGLTKAEKAV